MKLLYLCLLDIKNNNLSKKHQSNLQLLIFLFIFFSRTLSKLTNIEFNSKNKFNRFIITKFPLFLHNHFYFNQIFINLLIIFFINFENSEKDK